MQVATNFVELISNEKTMRTFVAQPVNEGQYPGLVLCSDIFQLSDPMLRICVRLAGHGFVVAAHEIFHRHENAGTVLAQTDEGRARGMANQHATNLHEFDDDCAAVIEYLQQHPRVQTEKIGAGGFCIGGHLAFRAALHPAVKSTVCFYPTWLHNGKLGAGENADSLARAAAMQGKMLIIFGLLDTLIPAEGRAQIIAACRAAGINLTTKNFAAEHGFVRDDRAAHDPECADEAIAAAVQFYRQTFEPA